MDNAYKTVKCSQITLSQLMLPSHSNFSGKIHGGYLLSLMDQIAFACGSKFSGKYCVTASVDRVDFLNPIEVGELVTLNASVNYVGASSMVVGIRVDAQNIQTGLVKHCNSSYFTMIAKDSDTGKPVRVPRLQLKSEEEIMRYLKAAERISLRKQRTASAVPFDGDVTQAIRHIEQHHDAKVSLTADAVSL
ncbi:acyl-CoA thioesterase [Alishewanella sp. 16-MA]|uniref:Acyl-CoA thioesterase n=1 Tax=Alishewanella maricola TaxID=2795740 RepID=A0ABS8C1W5_9ALTE|nr:MULTISPECIES: acyl-CoA thioesterase [Alishewanella]MDP4944146.1 acyl-CoA thioesterase [Alishewanella sp.]MCB5226316.1 acyl-CoA thioesterase [Alishewanella maricola]MDP5035674.1 acyl-CoA thioesterase [Alishewanella sp.]MDP5187105.1 acyl-CoA thioesterase [Alishewanella sp.]MDP5458989.1 acyl-CoA thioesterase [Alishewanella sp. SMS8]